MKKKLTPKQKQFTLEYLVDLNATKAAIRAGYSEKTATETGYENLRKPHIQTAIQSAIQDREKRTEIKSDEVLKNIKRIGKKAEQSDKYSDALKAQELLGRHLKMFTDKTELSGKGGAPVETQIKVIFVKPKQKAANGS